MTDIIANGRIAVANRIIETFAPTHRLYWRGHRLRICWGGKNACPEIYDFPADLRHDGSWLRYGYDCRLTGGTGFQAIAQMVRFVRDWTRFPIMTWEYWTGDKIGLGGATTLALIRDCDYGDPLKTCCVLCGTVKYERGLEWWSLDGVTGPACRYGRCRRTAAG